MMVQRFRLPRRLRAHVVTAAVLTASAVSGPFAAAQSYTCFPTCATNDGRMLALASYGNDAFAGNQITIGIGLPPNADTLEIGIFDGDTGGKDANNIGHWDLGAVALNYRIYADSTGDGSDTVLLGTYSGTGMSDNAWTTIKLPVPASALAPNGNYVFELRVAMPAGTITSTSAFKLRTNGTITVKAHQSFSISAPLTNNADAAIIYPDFSSTDLNNSARYVRKNYNGIWNIYLDVPQPSSALKIWDGDMDHGSALDATIVDTDDPNTANVKPSWATANAVAEGVTVANPKDDNSAIYNRHSPSVRYEVVFPDGVTSFQNNNPSGGLEWEQFRIDTQSTDSTVVDATASSIPAGIYTVRLIGMDMLNVNAWRFFNDVSGVPEDDNEVIGVNEAGLPIAPIRAIETVVNGAVAGTIYYDSDSSQTQDAGEPGIPSVEVKCHKLNSDGSVNSTVTTTTNIEGSYMFAQLGAGRYKIEVVSTTLQSDVIPTVDADGISTSGNATIEISANVSNVAATFGFKRSTVVSTGTRGYWVNHPEDWPVSALMLAGSEISKDRALEILRRPTRGDKSYSMAAQLIATKLNLASGSSASCIGEDVVAADDWLADHPMDQGKTSDTVWATGSTVHDKLDDYNNGELCAPHMN